MVLKVKNSCQIKVVSKVIMFEKNFGVQSNNFVVLLQTKKIEFVMMSLKAKCGPLLKLSLHV